MRIIEESSLDQFWNYPRNEKRMRRQNYVNHYINKLFLGGENNE